MSRILTCISTNRPENPNDGDTWFETDTQSIIVYGGANVGWITYGLESFKRNQEITIAPTHVITYFDDVLLDVTSSSGLEVFFSSNDTSIMDPINVTNNLNTLIESRVNGTSTSNLLLQTREDFPDIPIGKQVYAKISGITGKDAEDINGEWVPVIFGLVNDRAFEVVDSFNKEIDEIENLSVHLEVANLLPVFGTGEVTITATQPGNEEYFAAEPVETIITVVSEPEWVVGDEGVSQYSLSNPSDIAYDTRINDGGDPGQITYTLTSAANNSSGASILLLNPEQGTLSFTRAPDVNAGETGFYVIITATNIAGSDDKVMFIQVVE